MKLLNYHNKINLTATLIIITISSLCYFFALRYMLINELDNDLRVEQKEIHSFLKNKNSLPDTAKYGDQQIAIKETADTISPKYYSEEQLNKKTNEMEERRVLEFPVSLNGKIYEVYVSKSQEEVEDLLQLIVSATIAIGLFLIIALNMVNRIFLKKLWQPFYTSLKNMQEYDLSARNKMNFTESNIDEFNSLNKSIDTMVKHIETEYENMKTFTENASHEIQTPLAVIKAKIELLSQDADITSEQMLLMQSIHNSVSKLSKLNQSLLLLIKIDNKQFGEKKEISIKKIVMQFIIDYEEVIHSRNIKMVTTYNDEKNIYLNETLAEILVNNLLFNAVKHNIENGLIEVTLTEKKLTIKNTGKIIESDPGKLFQRFKKGNSASESLGLGLSIVKKICENNSFNISYVYENEMHVLSLEC